MLVNFGKEESNISSSMLKNFLFLFNKRSATICNSHKDVNERKERYTAKKGSKIFSKLSKMKSELNHLFKNVNGVIEPTSNRLYFIKKFQNHSVLFWIDFFEKKVFFIDPKQVDRAIMSEPLIEFFTEIKAKIRELFVGDDPNNPVFQFGDEEFNIEIYPYQYYQPDESNYQTDFLIIIILYFLEVGLPIWFNVSNETKVQMKVNFSYWLLTGYLPF
jgi:hypothetical protein